MTYAPDSDEPIWPAYHDGDDWRDGHTQKLTGKNSVTHWMNFPDYPGITQTCLWTPWDEDVYDVGSYATECGNDHCFIDGTIEYNNHIFCHYCGKEIRVLPDGGSE
jgi:hypothetical protein